MASEQGKLPAPPSRWVRGALVISLTVNLLLVGLAVGAVYNFKSAGGPPRNFDVSLGALGGALDSDARRELGRTMNRIGGDRPPRREERARAMADLSEVLRVTPFDPEALTALLQRQRLQWTGVQDTAQAALVAYVVALSPEDRANLADRLLQQGGPRQSEGRRD